jgi:hypothetical protein
MYEDDYVRVGRPNKSNQVCHPKSGEAALLPHSYCTVPANSTAFTNMSATALQSWMGGTGEADAASSGLIPLQAGSQVPNNANQRMPG